MIVCVCKGVNEREIRDRIHSGCSTEESIARQCGAGTDCGSCLPLLRDLLRGRSSHHSGPAASSPVAFDCPVM